MDAESQVFVHQVGSHLNLDETTNQAQQKIVSIVYHTEAVSRMNCELQILNSFFYQVAPSLTFPIYLRKKYFIP